ncbi:MAG: arsenate reductase [Burkholderiales bacterium]
MTTTVYGIKNCDTMKTAFAWLDAQGVDYVFHDYKKDGVPTAKLATWAKRVGWEKLVNTRGPTYRKIPEAERENLDEARAIKLLGRFSSAIKRPIVEADGNLTIGFDPDNYARTFGKQP